MQLFRKLTDEEQIDKWDKEEKMMLEKNYDIREGENNYPIKSYLLKPENIFATSYEKIKPSLIRINIGYKSNYNGYVTKTIRMNYDRIIKGVLVCEDTKSIQEVPYSEKSSISFPLFSSYKKIVFPVQNLISIEVKCKKIYIEHIDIYAIYNDQLILDDDYRIILEQNLTRNNHC